MIIINCTKGCVREASGATVGKRRGEQIVRAGFVLLLLCLASAALGQPSALSASEREKIEAIIAAVETRNDVSFIRNGKAYSAANAARFLRGKWQARAAEIRSANDFIAKVGTFSSTTGRPYLIRFRDGREMPSALFLIELLKKIPKQKQD